MPAAPRLKKVTYGTFEIGGSSDDRMLDDQVAFVLDPDVAAVEFSFVVQKDALADFDAEIAAVEEAFTTPYLRLLVEQSTSTLMSYDPSDSVNTGFNARPEILVRDEIAVNTGRSRRYHVRVAIDLPADLYDQQGRRKSRVQISQTPAGRRTMTLTGEWTALDVQGSARDQYAAQYPDWVSDLILTFGGTWDLDVENTAEADETDKIVVFRIVNEEILSAQSGVGLDDPDVKNSSLTIARKETQPGETLPARHLEEIAVRYSAWIVEGVDAESKYTNSLRTWLIDRGFAKFGSTTGAIADENASVDEKENRLDVTITLLAQIGDSTILQYARTEETNDTFGVVLVPAWTGDSLSYYKFEGPRKKIRTITHERRRLAGAGGGGGGGGNGFGAFVMPGGQAIPFVGGLGGGGFGGFSTPGGGFIPFAGPLTGAQQSALAAAVQGDVIPGGAAAAAGTDETWVPLVEILASTPRRIGQPDYFLDVVDERHVQIFQAAKLIGGGTGGGTASGGAP